MTKFSEKHMASSPVKQIAKDRVGRLRARAQRRSERSGETGGYDYEDRKVLELLNKADRIEKRNKILDSGFVKRGKGRKNKGRIYGEDPRIGESHERPDADSRSGINYGSPLKGAYAAGGGGGKYKSILPHIQQLNAAVSDNVRQVLEDRKDPEKEAERLQNRVERRQNRKDKKSQTAEFKAKTQDIIDRQEQKQQRADKKQKDPCFDEKTGKMKDPGTTAINSRGRIEYC
jgi:hypothetical protein